MDIVLRRADVVIQDLDPETMVFDPDSGEFHLLNPLAAFVFSQAEESTLPSEILKRARAAFGLDVQHTDIVAAVAELGRVRLLQIPEDIGEKGVTRRLMLQRLAATAVLAVPMITTLAAPAAALAVSPHLKQKCNQGVGNGPEGCDPGNSNQGNPARSNDELGGTPGDPGRKGGNGKQLDAADTAAKDAADTAAKNAADTAAKNAAHAKAAVK